MEAKFSWDDFVNVCCDRENRLNPKVRNLAIEPDPDKKVSDAARLARRADDLENSGEKIYLEGGLY